ncbi:MAG TPA: hypothetical protein VGP73_28515 [Thermoanaerobaculia bacterium]
MLDPEQETGEAEPQFAVAVQADLPEGFPAGRARWLAGTAVLTGAAAIRDLQSGSALRLSSARDGDGWKNRDDTIRQPKIFLTSLSFPCPLGLQHRFQRRF